MMKSIIIFLSLLIYSQAFAASFGAKHDAVVKHFQSNAEKTAKDAIWTAEDVFKVGVIDDGGSRDGYAQYVCAELNSRGFHNVSVKIVDIVLLTRQGKWKTIGSARCR